MPNYKLADTDVEDKQKTVTISEEVTKTEEEKVTVAQLKSEYDRKVEQIKSLGKDVDAIVDKLEEIDANITDINVENIPARICTDSVDHPEVPKAS